jgi:enoyl reductase-like protein
MSNIEKFINASMKEEGNAIMHLNFSAAGLVTDLNTSKDVGSTPTSGIYYMDAPGCIIGVSALADTYAIIFLPPAQNCPGKTCVVHAPTGLAAGDISVWDHETGAIITTYGDLDADADHVIFISTGIGWVLEYDGVA